MLWKGCNILLWFLSQTSFVLGPFSASASVCVHLGFISIKCALFPFFFYFTPLKWTTFLAIVSKRIIACLLAAAFSQGNTELNAKHKHRKGRATAHFALAIGKTRNALMKWILMYANGLLSQQYFCNFALNKWAANISIFRENWSGYHFHHHIHSLFDPKPYPTDYLYKFVHNQSIDLSI